MAQVEVITMLPESREADVGDHLELEGSECGMRGNLPDDECLLCAQGICEQWLKTGLWGADNTVIIVHRMAGTA